MLKSKLSNPPKMLVGLIYIAVRNVGPSYFFQNLRQLGFKEGQTMLFLVCSKNESRNLETQCRLPEWQRRSAKSLLFLCLDMLQVSWRTILAEETQSKGHLPPFKHRGTLEIDAFRSAESQTQLYREREVKQMEHLQTSRHCSRWRWRWWEVFLTNIWEGLLVTCTTQCFHRYFAYSLWQYQHSW